MVVTHQKQEQLHAGDNGGNGNGNCGNGGKPSETRSIAYWWSREGKKIERVPKCCTQNVWLWVKFKASNLQTKTFIPFYRFKPHKASLQSKKKNTHIYM